MANEITSIADLIIPELFNAYATERTTEKSALVRSGIIAHNPALDRLVSGGGVTINMPFWKPLDGDEDVMEEGVEIETGKITTAKDVAVVNYRAKGWAVYDQAAYEAGEDPVRAIADGVSDWMLTQETRLLLSILSGVFASTDMADHILTETAPLHPDMILDAKQLLGDAAGQLSTIAMHSKDYTELQKAGLIDLIPNTNPAGNVELPRYLGYNVLVDDAIAATDMYLFAAGSIARGIGSPVGYRGVETERKAALSATNVYYRRAFVLHPRGIRWQGVVNGVTPTNAAFASGGNWQRVVSPKHVGLVKLVHGTA